MTSKSQVYYLFIYFALATDLSLISGLNPVKIIIHNYLPKPALSAQLIMVLFIFSPEVLKYFYTLLKCFLPSP